MKKIELETPIDEMSESDLRETFSEVMDAHEENVAEFSEVQDEAEKAGEYAETIEELQADVDEAAGYFAEKASEITKLNSDVLVDRFSIDELVELAAQADEEAAFSEDADCPVDGCDGPADCVDPHDDDCADDGEEESLFAEKPSKAPDFSADTMETRKEAARQRLSRIGGVSLN